MKTPRRIVAVQAVAGLLALMYAFSAYDFIVNHHVSFIGYTAAEPFAQWAVANLGARLLGIACGFGVALVARSASLLALMLVVRLSSDVTDLWISTHTAGVAPSVGLVLMVFVSIEAICLAVLVHRIRTQEGKAN